MAPVLAQLNVARLHQPLDHPDTAEFVEALGPINALADAAPGFVWRLTDADGQSSSYVRADDDPLVIVNFSTWSSPEALLAFVRSVDHAHYLRRRSEWFVRSPGPSTVCWWHQGDGPPQVDDALRRLALLRADGPSAEAFGLTRSHPHSSPTSRACAGGG